MMDLENAQLFIPVARGDGNPGGYLVRGRIRIADHWVRLQTRVKETPPLVIESDVEVGLWRSKGGEILWRGEWDAEGNAVAKGLVLARPDGQRAALTFLEFE
jgi:hypothetical protein